MSWNSLPEAFAELQKKSHPAWESYLGYYSSWLGGFFKEPWGLLLPIDDHGFHRGDGVFEAVRVQNRAYFDFDSHLLRFESSAQKIGMKLPKSLAEIKAICVQLAKLCDVDSGILRLFVTRGPGGFSPNPAESVGSQLYAVMTRMRPPSEQLYKNGARAFVCDVAAKDPWFSQIKSLNYLQNVLMKQETVTKGYDFALSADASGRISEGSTENFMIINARGEMLVPRFDYTLRGTTVRVTMELAKALVEQKKLKDVRLDDIYIKDVLAAQEAAFVGTTLGVLPVTSLNDQPIGNGQVGSIAQLLHGQLLKKMTEDSKLRTPY